MGNPFKSERPNGFLFFFLVLTHSQDSSVELTHRAGGDDVTSERRPANLRILLNIQQPKPSPLEADSVKSLNIN